MEWRETSALPRVKRAIAAVAAGRMALVCDDADREDEADLVMSAAACTAADVAFMRRWGSGVISVPMLGPRLAELALPQMVREYASHAPHRTAFTVSVDATEGITTGISASDRATTIRALSDPGSPAAAFVRPGHVFPVRAAPSGVLERAGHTEAAVDLCRLAGRGEVAAVTELVRADGSMARAVDAARFGRRHRLPLITIRDLLLYRAGCERLVERVGAFDLPGEEGIRGYVYRDAFGREHIAVHQAGMRATAPRLRLALPAADLVLELVAEEIARDAAGTAATIRVAKPA